MTSPGTGLAFGAFRLFPDRRALMEGDEPVQIGGRAIDLLIALVENAGATLSHAELMARAWPNVTVEPISLRLFLRAGGQPLTETWLYEYAPPPPAERLLE